MKSLAFAFVAGLASAFAFEPVGVWEVMIFALAVLIWLIERAPTLRSALARGWWFGFGQFGLGLNWIATAFTYQAAMPAWLGWVAVVLLSLYLAIFPATAAGLAWRWGRVLGGLEKDGARRRLPTLLPMILILGAAWIVTEYFRSVLFTGFAWNPTGVALLPSGLAWTSRWIGTYGLSGLAVVFAGTMVLAIREETRKLVAVMASILGLAGAAWMFTPRHPEGGGATVRIVQPNIGQEQKWSPRFAARNMARLTELSRSGGDPPQVLIWPEAAITEPLQDERRLLVHQHDALATRRQAQRALAAGGLLLTGGVTVQSRDGLRATGATNSVFAMDASGRILGRYDKAHLVPYGEYLPLRPLLSAAGLSRLAPGDLDFDPGPGPRTLSVPGLGLVGFQLCYEIIFSGQVVDPVQRPAFIFNPSNDAWFGAWGPPQHLAQARMRALEEGLPVIRATPTGISAVVDTEGRVLEAIPHGEAGIIDAQLPLPAPPTLFSRLGNWLPFAFALLLVAAAIAVQRKAR